MRRIVMKARDVMASNVITADPNASVQEAARILHTNHISALPVVDQNGKLVGIISEGDLVRRVELETESCRSWWLELVAGRSKEVMAHEYIKSHSRKVADVMTTEVITAAPNTPLRDIAKLLEQHRIKRVPVVERDRIVGLVSRANLVRALATAQTQDEVPTTSDADIREKIMARFKCEPWAKFSTLNATVQSGTLELWGIVSSEAEKEAARVAAELVAGVDAVENYVVVRPSRSDL
jgi:CBS domain-containing protein